MAKTTTIGKFRSAQFFRRAAFSIVWLCGTAIVGMDHPQFVAINILVLPVAYFAFMSDWPLDQAGAAIVGIIVSTVMGPGLLSLAYAPAAGTVSKPAVIGTIAAILLAALATGFGLGRWVAQGFKADRQDH